jgi:hypothetical protein
MPPGRPVAVAGSISVMRPHVAGTDRFDDGIAYDEAQMRALYKQKAENLKDCGADLIILEMMRDSKFSPGRRMLPLIPACRCGLALLWSATRKAA